MTVQCCCCGQVRNESGEWSKPVVMPVLDVSHSYCDSCFADEVRRLAEYRAFMREEMVAA